MKNTSLIVLLFIIINGCNEKQMKTIRAEGLREDNLRINSLLFCNYQLGFAAGDFDLNANTVQLDIDDFGNFKSNAVLFRTTDGGYTWSKQEFGEGSINKVSIIDSVVYAFKIDQKTRRTTIYTSNDFGKTWLVEARFPEVVYDVFEFKGNRIFLARDEYFEFYSLDSGIWEKLNYGNAPVIDYITIDDDLYFLTLDSSSLGQPNTIIKTDGLNRTMIKLPTGFNCYLLGNENSRLVAIGVQDKRLTYYKIEDLIAKPIPAYDKGMNLFPKGFYSNGKESLTVVGKINGFGVDYKILIRDSLNRWTIKEFNNHLFVYPFCFYGKGESYKAWFYFGSALIQVLE